LTDEFVSDTDNVILIVECLICERWLQGSLYKIHGLGHWLIQI